MIKISIIIPVYNVENYLRECLNSVVNQTLHDIEIICVDDGSTDNSGKILDEYAQKDNRVRVIHKQNGGYGTAINTGLSIAEGEYIGIVESDDFIEKNMYEILYNDAKTFDVDIVKGQYYILRDKNKVLDIKHKNIPSVPFTVYDYPQILLHHASIWSAIYKADFIKSNKIKMFEKNKGKYADQVWRFEAMCLAKKIFIETEPLYNYREFALGNTTSVKGAKTPDDIFDLYVELNKFFTIHSTLYEQIKEYYFAEIFWHTLFNIQRCDKSCHKYILDKFKKMFKDQIDLNIVDNMKILSTYDKNSLKNMLNGSFKIQKNSFLQQIFSLKNRNQHKILTICGIQIKLKRKSKCQ